MQLFDTSAEAGKELKMGRLDVEVSSWPQGSSLFIVKCASSSILPLPFRDLTWSRGVYAIGSAFEARRRARIEED